jgi:putative methionine-R-sulfoxide reductase with GAF domain
LLEKEIVSEEKDKPVFDEQTLAKFLEAAYVLQEHNRRLREMELRLQPESRSAGVQESGLQESPFREIESQENGLPNMPPPESASTATAYSQGAPENTPPLAPPPKDDYTQTLAQIVEIQHQIQVRHLELDHAMSLVAERVTEIARASGAAVGILEGKNVGYRASYGLMTLPAGSSVPMEKALCVASLRTGQVIRCTDVNTEFLLDAEECRRRSIQSLIAVPIYHDGGIAGALELFYPATQAFAEQDVHTCQLMAGLITEALARNEELTSKKSRADERAVMLAALEKLKPNLAALVDASAAHDAASTAAAEPAVSCRKCGNKLVRGEQFCGKCGLPRASDYEPPNMQSKVASLWQMQEAMKKKPVDATANGDLSSAEQTTDSKEEPTFGPLETAELPAREKIDTHYSESLEKTDLDDLVNHVSPKRLSNDSSASDDVPEEEAEHTAETAVAWSSAATARDFLEQLADPPKGLGKFWKARRGDVYLAVAVILVACVIRWGIWSNHSVSATGNTSSTAAGHRPPAPEADLSLFDRMLIQLGLADPPEPPENKGNPDTQVWIDLQTALYYCPGADLYGKTPKGRLATQRDAQLDQFEPALRKACD